MAVVAIGETPIPTMVESGTVARFFARDDEVLAFPSSIVSV
jgi:hypothetical protein